MKTAWYVARDPDGSVSRVIRIRDEADGPQGEFFHNGAWVQDEVVLQVVHDDTWGSPVSAEEGERIVRNLDRAN